MTAWTAIIPVKPWALAKVRLNVSVSNEHRAELARAFSLDVLRCVVDTPEVGQVIVVTVESELQARASSLGAVVLNDRPLFTSDPLNDAVRLGRSWALINRPSEPIVVIPGDLPSLTPGALTLALDAMSGFKTAFVPDGEGLGTTLLSAVTPQRLRPFYGAESCRRHCASGCHPVVDVDPRVRRDVDTVFDFSRARELGIGKETGRAARLTSGPSIVNGKGAEAAFRAM